MAELQNQKGNSGNLKDSLEDLQEKFEESERHVKKFKELNREYEF